jgi:hypothetical protein
VIKTTIQFKCTWPKAKVQKLFNSLVNADGITELGTSMIFTLDEPTPTEEPEPAEIPTPEPKHTETEPLKQIDIPWPAKEEPQEQVESDPDIFSEIERIHDTDLGQEHHTSKPILTYAETEDGRVAIYYHKDTAVYTTMDTVRALPDKIPANMIPNLHAGKRAALRGFKKFLTGLDASENETSPKYDTDIDPYAPVLTGGARPDTHASGKVEGDLE